MHVRVELAPNDELSFPDVVLVVDVLRATTTATALLERGVHTLILADSLASARALREEGEILIGEDGGLNPEAFDFGNSPREVRQRDFSGKTAILITSNSTRAAHLAARCSQKVALACLNNVQAACSAAMNLAEKEVTLLCAGSAGKPSSDDTYTAGVLATRLIGFGLIPQDKDVEHALNLCQSHPDALSLFVQTGAYLERMGVGGDIGACAEVDMTQAVAMLQGRRRTCLSFRRF